MGRSLSRLITSSRVWFESIKCSRGGGWVSFDSSSGYKNIRAGVFSEKHDLWQLQTQETKKKNPPGSSAHPVRYCLSSLLDSLWGPSPHSADGSWTCSLREAGARSHITKVTVIHREFTFECDLKFSFLDWASQVYVSEPLIQEWWNTF